MLVFLTILLSSALFILGLFHGFKAGREDALNEYSLYIGEMDRPTANMVLAHLNEARRKLDAKGSLSVRA